MARAGQWTKGQSGNPTGRPKGAAGLARYAAEKTNNGQDMIDLLIAIAKGDGYSLSTRDRIAAAQAVLDRVHGRPMQSLELQLATQADAEELPIRPASLQPADAFAIGRILREAKQRALAESSTIIDVPASSPDHATIVGITPEGATILAALSSSDRDPDPYDEDDGEG